jgi:hypothetical protein
MNSLQAEALTSSRSNLTPDECQHWIWVFGDRVGFEWMVSEGLMGFSRAARARAGRIKAGDRAVVYLAQGAQAAGCPRTATFQAVVTTESRCSEVPAFEVGGRELVASCQVSIDRRLPDGMGVNLKAVVAELDYVTNPENWGAYFRMSPIPIGLADFERIVEWMSGVSR